MKFSLLMPTRNRPGNVRRLVHSLTNTVHDGVYALRGGRIQIIAYLDDDDDTSAPTCEELGISFIRGPRINLSDMWNKCYEAASPDAELFMLAGDDMIFKTNGWDLMVERAFQAFDDRLILVHGDDRYFGPALGTHCFVHRKWIETIGYFTPRIFSAEYADTWVNHVAEYIGRRIFLPFIVEHPHPEYGGGAPIDDTHKDRINRRNRDNVSALYQATARDRLTDSMKIFAAIQAAYPETYSDAPAALTAGESP